MKAKTAGKLIERLVATLPPRQVYRLAKPLSGLLLRGKTERLLADTGRLFPDRSEKWVRETVARQRYHRAWNAVDKFMITKLTGAEIVAMHDADDVRMISELADEALARGKGGIIYTMHYGRPAWSPYLLAELGYPYVGLIRGSGGTGSHEQHASVARERGAELVEAGDLASGVHALRGLKQNKFVFVVVDGQLTQRMTMVELAGRKLPMSLAFAQLARRTGAQLLAGVTYTGDDPMKLKIKARLVDTPPDGLSPEELGRTLVEPLEEMILEDPGQWYGINRLFREARRHERDLAREAG